MAAPDVELTGCCDPFDPDPWDEQEIAWDRKLFVKDRIHSLLHIPLDIGSKVQRNMDVIETAGAKADVQLMLVDENSLWGADIYINVGKEVPGAAMVEISGTFLTKVYDGPFSEAQKWAADMKEYVSGRGKDLQQLFFSYTTCPKCAKAYGHNYVVLFARVA